MQSVRGRNVLIVEDEYLLAAELSRHFRMLGATVLGPASTLEAAAAQLPYADAAVLDIDVNGERVFGIADELSRRGVPFVFFTGHSDIVIPERFRYASHLMKPADREAVSRALFANEVAANGEAPAPAADDDVISLLPKLRLSARLLLGQERAADRLVELTLERAISEVAKRPTELPLESWLTALMERTLAAVGSRLLN